jgi:hypothetical protein
MDSEGIVRGLTVKNNSFSIDIGNSWQDLWPLSGLAGNISFTFNYVNKQWLAEVHQLTSNGTIQASYLATYTRMSEQAEYKNNQLKKLQHKLQFYETVIIESHD